MEISGINYVFFAVLLLLVGGCVKGYMRGMVEEVASTVGLVLALIAIGMFVVAAKGYMEQQAVRAILGIVCMVIAVLTYKITDFIFSSLKIISKIPVIRGANKLLGFAAGGAEAILLIWIVFIIVVAFEFGGIGVYIIDSVKENAFLSFLFQNNYLAKVLAGAPLSGLPAAFGIAG